MITCDLVAELDPVTGKRASTSRVTPLPAPFTALLLDDFSSGTPGESVPGWHTRSVYANDQPEVSGQTMKVVMLGATPPTCGGAHGYGGRFNMPVDIPKGNTVWVSMKRYHPTTQSWGYCYSDADSVEAAGCGKAADGNQWLKDFVLGPSIGTSRIYTSPYVQRRSVAQEPGFRLIAESSQDPVDDLTVSLPIGEWYTMQLMVKVGDGVDGIMRAWINDELVAEYIGQNIDADVGNVMRSFGIGDYWNGIPYTDGADQMHYWCRELIMATDVDGYGIPTGLDALGNAYISPLTTVAELS